MTHYPHGHTDGDSIVYFKKSNVLHMGDDMFAGMFPFVDIDHGGSVVGLISNIDKILADLPRNVKIIPGHGPLSSPDDLEAYHTMLVETTDIVRQRIKQGKSLKQIQGEGLPARWEKWGTGFIKTDGWLESIHRSLTEGHDGHAHP